MGNNRPEFKGLPCLNVCLSLVGIINQSCDKGHSKINLHPTVWYYTVISPS